MTGVLMKSDNSDAETDTEGSWREDTGRRPSSLGQGEAWSTSSLAASEGSRPSRHLGLGLPASRAVRRQTLVDQTIPSWCLVTAAPASSRYGKASPCPSRPPGFQDLVGSKPSSRRPERCRVHNSVPDTRVTGLFRKLKKKKMTTRPCFLGPQTFHYA